MTVIGGPVQIAGSQMIQLSYTSSATKFADMFTKPLTGAVHHVHLHKLGVLSPSNLLGVLRLVQMVLHNIFG